jgi:hypothetical protein
MLQVSVASLDNFFVIHGRASLVCRAKVQIKNESETRIDFLFVFSHIFMPTATTSQQDPMSEDNGRASAFCQEKLPIFNTSKRLILAAR